MKNILIYGGSFDPPHLGHIKTACAVQKKFAFDRFIFVPCKQPVLKAESLASPKQRLDMLELALAPHAQFKFEIDTRELDRDTPSFMVDTLISIQQDYKNNASITLLLGMDSFLELPRWHQWKKIITLCDLLVIQRAGEHHPKEISFLLPCRLNFFDAGNYPIASSKLRERIKAGEQLEKNLLPEAVYDYIMIHRLYQSSQIYL